MWLELVDVWVTGRHRTVSLFSRSPGQWLEAGGGRMGDIWRAWDVASRLCAPPRAARGDVSRACVCRWVWDAHQWQAKMPHMIAAACGGSGGSTGRREARGERGGREEESCRCSGNPQAGESLLRSRKKFEGAGRSGIHGCVEPTLVGSISDSMRQWAIGMPRVYMVGPPRALSAAGTGTFL